MKHWQSYMRIVFMNGFHHCDVRLENICFKEDYSVMFIDMDRSRDTDSLDSTCALPGMWPNQSKGSESLCDFFMWTNCSSFHSMLSHMQSTRRVENTQFLKEAISHSLQAYLLTSYIEHTLINAKIIHFIPPLITTNKFGFLTKRSSITQLIMNSIDNKNPVSWP